MGTCQIHSSSLVVSIIVHRTPAHEESASSRHSFRDCGGFSACGAFRRPPQGSPGHSSPTLTQRSFGPSQRQVDCRRAQYSCNRGHVRDRTGHVQCDRRHVDSHSTQVLFVCAQDRDRSTQDPSIRFIRAGPRSPLSFVRRSAGGECHGFVCPSTNSIDRARASSRSSSAGSQVA